MQKPRLIAEVASDTVVDGAVVVPDRNVTGTPLVPDLQFGLLRQFVGDLQDQLAQLGGVTMHALDVAVADEHGVTGLTPRTVLCKA